MKTRQAGFLSALALALSALLGMTFFSGSDAAPAPQPTAVSLSSGQVTIYLGEGSGFTSYDVADKSHPRQVAGLPLDGADVN